MDGVPRWLHHFMGQRENIVGRFGNFFGVWFRRFARQFLARPAHPTAAFLGLTRECLSQPIA
jgi:hypothetical protein